MVNNIGGNYIEAMHIGGRMMIASNKTSFFHKDLIDHGLMSISGTMRVIQRGKKEEEAAVSPAVKKKNKKSSLVHSILHEDFFSFPHPEMNVAQYDAFKKSQLSRENDFTNK